MDFLVFPPQYKTKLQPDLKAKSARTAIQKLRETSNKKDAQGLLVYVTSMLDKLAKKNIIHNNKAANLKSKLTKHVNSL